MWWSYRFKGFQKPIFFETWNVGKDQSNGSDCVFFPMSSSVKLLYRGRRLEWAHVCDAHVKVYLQEADTLREKQTLYYHDHLKRQDEAGFKSFGTVPEHWWVLSEGDFGILNSHIYIYVFPRDFSPSKNHKKIPWVTRTSNYTQETQNFQLITSSNIIPNGLHMILWSLHYYISDVTA